MHLAYFALHSCFGYLLKRIYYYIIVKYYSKRLITIFLASGLFQIIIENIYLYLHQIYYKCTRFLKICHWIFKKKIKIYIDGKHCLLCFNYLKNIFNLFSQCINFTHIFGNFQRNSYHRKDERLTKYKLYYTLKETLYGLYHFYNSMPSCKLLKILLLHN